MGGWISGWVEDGGGEFMGGRVDGGWMSKRVEDGWVSGQPRDGFGTGHHCGTEGDL